MSEILFGQSYYLSFDVKLWQAMQPYPPLGTLYAASYLRDLGYRVALFDAMLADSESGWAAALDCHKPVIAVIYEDNFNYLSKMCLARMRQAAFNMIEMARQRGCLVILAGADASDHPEMYLRRGADFILVGEGELTLGELVDRLWGRSERPFSTIKGLAYLVENGQPLPTRGRGHTSSSQSKLFTTPRRPEIRQLDDLPFPAWDLIDMSHYREIWRQRHGYHSLNMVTTRGCPYHCNWCAKPIWGQRYNARSPENVVAEMQWLAEAYQPDHIWFVDDIFGLKPGWVAHFASLLKNQPYRLPFKSLNRVDLLLRPGEIEALQRAGCHTVWVGAESGSQKILDAMEKGTKVEQILRVSARLRQAGIQVGFFLQFGYPGERLDDIARTFQLLRAGRPDDIGMSVSYPLPGTKFFQAVKMQLGDKQNWDDSRDLAMLYRGPFSTAFYRQLHVVLHKEFRARKTWFSLLNSQRRRPYLGSSRRRLAGAIKMTGRMILDFASLPFERMRLSRLARQPHQGLDIHSQGLSPEEAARPTPQRE
jgi:anaerobic magnesium-protoporphyrin IX monomethyl ester cyclase